MKEATGELNMTVVTLIAIAAVGALFYIFVWPMIQKSIVTQTCKTYGSDWKAYSFGDAAGGTGSNAKVKKWVCCPGTEEAPTSQSDADNKNCVDAEIEDIGGGAETETTE